MSGTRWSKRASAAFALAAALGAAIVVPAHAADENPTRESPAPPGMTRMHELMVDGNPGMARMHELMMDGNPGMARMHELMIRQGTSHDGR